MLRRDASLLFRSILLTAVGTACGGAVDAGSTSGGTKATGTGSSSSGGSSTSSSGSTSGGGSSSGGSSGMSSTSSSSGSTSGSTSSSSSSGSTSSSSGSTSGNTGGCFNGSVAPSKDYCCPPGASCTGQAAGGDETFECTINCDLLCESVAPTAPQGFRSCNWNADGNISYYCGACGVGRIADGTAPCPSGETVAERLAHQAYYEAASVVAFDRLVVALERAGAPHALVARARAAAVDEARHASLFGDLAQKHGVTPMVLDSRPAAPSLFELALENATEGCVRETFGAIVTLHQATHAESADVRAAFAAIAEDEAEHAALSWELKAWFDTQLTAAERIRVQNAHDDAVILAHRDAATAPDAPGLALGLPEAARAEQMLGALMSAMAIAA